MVSKICSSAGFFGNFSSHSLRTTCATRLFQNGIEEQLVSSITGHSSSAVRSYKRPCNNQLREISRVLQCVNTTNCNSSIATNYTPSNSNVIVESSENAELFQQCPLSGNVNLNNEGKYSIYGPTNKSMRVSIDGNANIINVNFN